MVSILEKYGIVTIPVGFKVYHTEKTNFDPYNCNQLYCLFSSFWYNTSYKYIVTFRKEISVLFMVNKINKNTNAFISSATDIYRGYYPEDKNVKNQLDIKCDYKLSQTFVEKLKM